MTDLNNILKGLDIIEVIGKTKAFTGKLCFDSRQVEKSDLFVAVRGTQSDGHSYMDEVAKKGAAVIVCEELPEKLIGKLMIVLVKDTHKALALIASNYYGNPSKDLRIIGITGTNGKTTIASLLFNITESLGYKAGLISTIKIKYDQYERSSTHTTPDPLQIQASLREMVDAGVEYVYMEVSSHAVHQKRVAWVHFTGGVFTNLTHDHLDYHKTFSEYLLAKKAFFDMLPKSSFALTNADDKNAQIILQNSPAKKYSYGIKSMADYKAKILESHFEGNLLKINKKEVWTQLPGDFNASNIMAIYGVGMLLGFDETELLEQISRQKSVEGRFEVIRSKRGRVAIVDYAHTPDALANVLKTIRSIRIDGQQIITIVGAGGNRDKTKRPEMARIAADLSEKVVLTSDNPRNEEPEAIIEDMKAGLDPVQKRKVISITDRDEAIKATCAFANPEDIILVAGKGHETYQEVKGIRHHFDDREKLKEYLML